MLQTSLEGNMSMTKKVIWLTQFLNSCTAILPQQKVYSQKVKSQIQFTFEHQATVRNSYYTQVSQNHRNQISLQQTVKGESQKFELYLNTRVNRINVRRSFDRNSCPCWSFLPPLILPSWFMHISYQKNVEH